MKKLICFLIVLTLTVSLPMVGRAAPKDIVKPEMDEVARGNTSTEYSWYYDNFVAAAMVDEEEEGVEDHYIGSRYAYPFSYTYQDYRFERGGYVTVEISDMGDREYADILEISKYGIEYIDISLGYDCDLSGEFYVEYDYYLEIEFVNENGDWFDTREIRLYEQAGGDDYGMNVRLDANQRIFVPEQARYFRVRFWFQFGGRGFEYTCNDFYVSYYTEVNHSVAESEADAELKDNIEQGFDSIVNPDSGDKDAANDFKDQVDSNKQEASDIKDQLDSVNKPDADELRDQVNPDQFIDKEDESVIEMNAVIASVFDLKILGKYIMVLLGLGFVSLVFFGKKEG